MQLKFLKAILEAENEPARIRALAWSPNNQKLAVATSERTVLLFDENGTKRNKFSLKPCDTKFGKKSFTTTALAFSPDSTKIAVGQSDNIVYVYKIGEDWNDKKVICNKFLTTAAITALVWLSEGPLIFGTADGKIRQGNQKSNKATTLYATDSFVVSLASNIRGTGFLSGHADGSVVRFYAVEDVSPEPQGRVLNHPVPPYAIVWSLNHILIGGCDQKIVAYNKDGRSSRVFDYSRENEKEFTVACCSPSGQAAAFGSFNRIRLLYWSPAKGVWEESPLKEIKNMFTVTALAWRKDGSRVACGTLCRSVLFFETVLKRTIWKNKFEMTYVGPSQVLVKPLTENASRGVVLKSQYGHEIDDVRIMGKDNYLVARTSHTLLLGDLTRNLLSEIMWPNSGRNEKFYFDNANVCLIFNVGELTLVEYGVNDILGSVRTDFMNPHLISVRLNERKTSNGEDNKKLAYLLDLKTIRVVDLVLGTTVCQLSHDSKVDWLELNETGHILLFRDKRQRLFLVDTVTSTKETIVTNCTFVQWVPGSDVVVAQSQSNLCIWYNIDTPSNMTVVPIKGEIVDVLRGESNTEVIVQEGIMQLGYQLDEGLLEFGTAVHDNDFGRAILFLEGLESSRPETEGMWRNLASLALEKQNLKIAERCFAALGDISKTFYLNEIVAIGQEYSRENDVHILACPEVWIRLAILNKDLATAEQIYLEQGQYEKAIQMYQNYHRWEEALKLADRINYSDKEKLEEDYVSWLLSTGQEEKLAEVKERNGDIIEAIDLYLKGKKPVKAAKMLLKNSYLSHDDVINKVVSALRQWEHYEHAGDLYEQLNNHMKALECYKLGRSYGKALEIARKIAPHEIVSLEEEWGDYLAEGKQLDAAVNHYIEAGKTVKAIEAAVAARQWKKAIQIIQVIDDTTQVKHLLEQIGNHFASAKDFVTAESMLLKAGLFQEVIEMYNKAGLWGKGHRVAMRYLNEVEASEVYLKIATNLENEGKIQDAEQIYVAVGEIDKAILMCKKHRKFDDMIRLVQAHRSDLLGETLVQLGQELENNRQWPIAESYYVRGGEWARAVAMYRKMDMWEEAFKVAKNHGGEEAEMHIAIAWAKKLGGGEAAARLLKRLNLLDKCLDFACENDEFDVALSLAKITQPDKLPDLHIKYAVALEDDGKFSDAEEHFIAGNKPREAISMYIHMREWERAEKIANEYDTEAFSEIYSTRAAYALQEGDFAAVESYLLRAQRPDLLIENFKKAGMWADAIRVCREYLPSKLSTLQALYNKEMLNNGDDLLSMAREYERMGQYKDAIRYYIRLSQESEDNEDSTQAMLKAADLTIKFVEAHEAIIIARNLCPRLIEAKEFDVAASLYVEVDSYKEAVDTYILAEDWDKARKIAREYNSDLEPYIEERLKGHLTFTGNIDQLADMDGLAALNILYSQGQWEQLFAKAKTMSPQILHKYVAQRATSLLRKGDVLEALKLYQNFDAPAISANYNIYKKIALEIFGMPGLSDPESYYQWAALRNVMYALIKNLASSSDANTDIHHEFETLHLISHYYATKCAFKGILSMDDMVTKISFALLRYSDIIPADKAFYEAGNEAKNVGRENEAFIFWNHYLDIVDAIEEDNPDIIDSSDFMNTDFPLEIPLPSKMFLTKDKHQDIKDWVLKKSMDVRSSKILPMDGRNLFESSLTSINSTQSANLPCIVTGYPIITSQRPLTFSKPGKFANRDDWNTLITLAKSKGGNLQDVNRFIEEWCGTASSTF